MRSRSTQRQRAQAARALAALLSAAFLLACGDKAAAPVSPLALGDTLAPFELEDPHGELHRVDAQVRLVILSHDMDGGQLVRDVLAEGGAAALERAQAVYIADIHGMPAVISRMIAIPRMRDRPYPTLLDLDGRASEAFPRREGEATWMRLDALAVTELGFATSSDEVRALLAP